MLDSGFCLLRLGNEVNNESLNILFLRFSLLGSDLVSLTGLGSVNFVRWDR